MPGNILEFVRKKIRTYAKTDVRFGKTSLSTILHRLPITAEDAKQEIFATERIIFAEQQERRFMGTAETRYRCHYLLPGGKWRCYVLTFNSHITIVTLIPFGRRTMRKYRKRFKG